MHTPPPTTATSLRSTRSITRKLARGGDLPICRSWPRTILVSSLMAAVYLNVFSSWNFTSLQGQYDSLIGNDDNTALGVSSAMSQFLRRLMMNWSPFHTDSSYSHDLAKSQQMKTRKEQIWEEEEAMVLPTNHHALPPIYWINLDSSIERRKTMLDMFLSLGITDTHRIAAYDINATLDLWNSDRLIFHPNVTLEAQDGRPANKKHLEHIYEYQEAACLMSHLKAIQKAYKDGHSQVLILEDDAHLTASFRNQWKPYIDQAPLDWKILQFSTTNEVVAKQGLHLIDPFVTWQPYHWSTQAYIINRAGMQTLMDKFHSLSQAGQPRHDIWHIIDQPMVVADEVVYYYLASDAYTSTGLLMNSFNFRSTIQAKNAHSNISSLIGDSMKQDEKQRQVGSSNTQELDIYNTNKFMLNNLEARPESMLILMSIVARDLEELMQQLRWIQQDNYFLMKMHNEKCIWEINFGVADADLLEALDQATLSSNLLPSNVHIHTHVATKAFNKFAYIRNIVSELADYDLILFKDNDQRIAGFPWRTFVDRKGDAIVSGPLRQHTEEALLWRRGAAKRQYFQFHAAEGWAEDSTTSWSSELFANVIPTEVPLLEMYFVLMDAKFAQYFFDLILTPEFVNQSSAWGPDLLWCGAALEWNSKRPSCHLVPVTSSHEDSRQIAKGIQMSEQGKQMVALFKENEQFEKWMRVPEKWIIVIGQQLLWQVERRCRKLLKLRMIYPFELSTCVDRVHELVTNFYKSGGENPVDTIGIENLPSTMHISKLPTPISASRLKNLGFTHLGTSTKNDGENISSQNRAQVADLVRQVKAKRLDTVNKGNDKNVIQSPAAQMSAEMQKKNLDAFQARVAELKKKRESRLAGTDETT